MKKHASSLIIFENQVLLLHRDNIPTIPDPDTWQAIGGHVEEGEDFDTAIIREIKEETNLSPKNIKYIGKLVRPGNIVALYLVRLSDEEVKDLKLGNEGQEVRFFKADEIDGLNLSPTVSLFVARYKEKLVELVRGGDVCASDFGLVE